MAIAADHPLSVELEKSNPELAKFNNKCRQMGTSLAAIETAEKMGFDTELKIAHPFIEGKQLPLYVANFILMDYGTGAIFGCPAHDQRDLDFARQYNLEVTAVVAPNEVENDGDFEIENTAYVGEGHMINSGFLDGLNETDAFEMVVDRLSKTKLGGKPQGSNRSSTACATGACRASDTGVVRYR